MADYAIGLSFHKAHRTLVRAIALNSPCRYFATRSDDGIITLPTLDTGDTYVEIQGVTQANFQINDNNQEFRLLGDDGWNDSVITGAGVTASCTSYFLSDSEIPSGQNCPEFRGDYEEGFKLIQRARYDKEYEIYFEFLKEIGQTNNDYMYDFTGFNAVITNYSENMSAEGLTEVTYDLVSRGRPVFGRYNNGTSELDMGQIQSTLLWTATGSGDRRYTVVPANNASNVVVGNNLTVTYTSDGTQALTQLTLGDENGSGYKLFNSSTGAQIDCAVTIGTGGNANQVTIDPNAALTAATIYDLRVEDGAIMQSVNAQGAAAANGTKRPLEGFKSSFRTA